MEELRDGHAFDEGGLKDVFVEEQDGVVRRGLVVELVQDVLFELLAFEHAVLESLAVNDSGEVAVSHVADEFLGGLTWAEVSVYHVD